MTDKHGQKRVGAGAFVFCRFCTASCCAVLLALFFPVTMLIAIPVEYIQSDVVVVRDLWEGARGDADGTKHMRAQFVKHYGHVPRDEVRQNVKDFMSVYIFTDGFRAKWAGEIAPKLKSQMTPLQANPAVPEAVRHWIDRPVDDVGRFLADGVIDGDNGWNQFVDFVTAIFYDAEQDQSALAQVFRQYARTTAFQELCTTVWLLSDIGEDGTATGYNAILAQNAGDENAALRQVKTEFAIQEAPERYVAFRTFLIQELQGAQFSNPGLTPDDVTAAQIVADLKVVLQLLQRNQGLLDQKLQQFEERNFGPASSWQQVLGVKGVVEACEAGYAYIKFLKLCGALYVILSLVAAVLWMILSCCTKDNFKGSGGIVIAAAVVEVVIYALSFFDVWKFNQWLTVMGCPPFFGLKWHIIRLLVLALMLALTYGMANALNNEDNEDEYNYDDKHIIQAKMYGDQYSNNKFDGDQYAMVNDCEEGQPFMNDKMQPVEFNYSFPPPSQARLA